MGTLKKQAVNRGGQHRLQIGAGFFLFGFILEKFFNQRHMDPRLRSKKFKNKLHLKIICLKFNKIFLTLARYFNQSRLANGNFI